MRDGSESGIEGVGDDATEQQEGAESTESVCVIEDKIVCGVRVQRRCVQGMEVRSERSRVESGDRAETGHATAVCCTLHARLG